MGSFAASANTSFLLGSNTPVPSGTANGVLYLNGSKVPTSGSALTFDGTNFTTTGSATATAFVPSAATVPTNGMYLGAANTLTWAINSGEAMRLNSTGLGIGTNNPQYRLDIVGTNPRARIQPSTGTEFALYQAQNTGGSAFVGLENSAGSGLSTGVPYALTVFHTGAYPILFGTSSATRMTLDASGNLGLGVTPAGWTVRVLQTPSNYAFGALGISNNGFFDGGWKYLTSAAATLHQSSAGQHAWYTAPSGTAGNAITFTQVMTLDGGTTAGSVIGRVAIGTTSLTGTITSGGPIAIVGTFGGLGGSVRYIGSGGSSSNLYFNVPASSAIQFAKNEVIFAQFTGAGNFVFDSTGSNFVAGAGATATNATDGFLYVPTCAGTPTGTPTTYTGRVPIVVDTTNNKLYFYSGGAWRDAGP